MENNNFGINISGYINKQFGLGEGVRSNIRSIKTTDVPYVLNDFNIQISKFIQDDQNEEISPNNPYDINLIQINIDKLLQVIGQTDKKYFQGKYNIGFWAWELENFPEESNVFFNLFNEIWVPSNFCTEAISKVSPVPVLKFMHSIEIETPGLTRSDFNLPENRFIFLTMFDYYSSIHRKNPIGAVEAYEKAFGKNHSSTLLVIKSSLSNEFPREKKQLLDRIGNNSSIILVEEVMERERLFGLMNCCDSFVSLHRSEGFGLTMAEAMYLGKPVIATGYSANTEFMNLNNSFLVKYNLIKTGNLYYFSTEDDIWADPDLSHAAEMMKYVLENPDHSKTIADQGQQYIKRNLAPKLIGKKIEKRLKFIHTELFPKMHAKTSSAEALLLLETKIQQQKINKLRELWYVKFKENFKNFQNKFTGKKRKYMWED